MSAADAPAAPDNTAAGAQPYIVCDNLVKIYKTEDLEVVALQGLDLVVQRGEIMAIIGNSGSGKSSLLNVLGGLDRPTAGQCRVGDLDILQASESDLVDYKRYQVGFVWQQSSRNLVPYLTAFENVRLPMLFGNMRKASQRARALLTSVGLEDRMHHKLSQLSGGQQQRVAIAIALANDPDLLLADEPTGEVDTQTAGQIYDILRYLNRERGLTIIIVSHDRNIARQVDRVVAIRDGRTSTETVRRVSVHEDGDDHTHDEFVIVDDTGRLQVPSEMLEQLSIRGRAVVDMEGDRIVIRSSSSSISTVEPTRTDGAEAPAGREAPRISRVEAHLDRTLSAPRPDDESPRPDDEAPRPDDGPPRRPAARPSSGATDAADAAAPPDSAAPRIVPTEQRVVPAAPSDARGDREAPNAPRRARLSAGRPRPAAPDVPAEHLPFAPPRRESGDD